VNIRRQRGLSLIELMIGLAIGLGLLAALTTVFVNSSRSQAETVRATQQIENGRFATQTIQDDVWHAGFYGRYVAYTTAAPAALPDPCSTNLDTAVATPTPLQNSLVFAVQGYNDPATVPTQLSGCLADEDFVPGTDILVVRRAESLVTPSASLTGSAIYLQSVAEAYNPTTLQAMRPVIALGSSAGSFNLASPTTGELGEIRRFHVHVYFIAPCSVPAGGGTSCTGASDDGGRPIPTLKRLELSTSGAFNVIPLVEGIENMQLEYGVDAVPGSLPANSPYAGDGMPDSYIAAPTAAEFSQVVAVRVYLLARANEATQGYTDNKTYDLGLHGTVASADAYKRKVFETVIRVQNVAGWREK
jgi:type IV pilus assembly protein PilW